MKKTLVSLLLAVAMLLTMIPVWAGAEEAPTLTVMLSDVGRTWDPTVSNVKKIMELSGVNIDAYVADRDAMTLSFASGDLADIIVMSDLTYSEYVNTGKLLPLNDLLEEHGENLLAHTSEFGLAQTTINGNIYAMPFENCNVKYFTYMRKDWLSKIGFDLESHELVEGSTDVYYITLDEYTDILKAFTFDDPDCNGKDDTYGFGVYDTRLWYCLMAVMGAHGGLMDQNYAIDGVVYPFITTENYRNAVEYLKSLWDEGVFDPEFFIAKDFNNITVGKSGTFVGWWSAAYGVSNSGLWDICPEADWATVEIVGPDGYVGMKDNGRVTSTYSITTNCENPELAMEFLNFLNSDEGWWLVRYGIEGEHYTLDEQGYAYRTAEGKALYDTYTLDPLYTLTNRRDLENFTDSAPQTDPKLHYRWVMQQHQFLEKAPLYTDVFYGVAKTEASARYQVDVDNYVNTALMQFIIGEVELNDDNWNAFIEQWKTKGGAEILQSYVKAMNEVKGTDYVSAF